VRGPWPEKTPERECKAAMERLRLANEGTIDTHVLSTRERRKAQTAQERGPSHEGFIMVHRRFC
jgi:hypothetical protein